MSCISLIYFINNKRLYVDKETWFDQLQDVGGDMTGDEKQSSK